MDSKKTKLDIKHLTAEQIYYVLVFLSSIALLFVGGFNALLVGCAMSLAVSLVFGHFKTEEVKI